MSGFSSASKEEWEARQGEIDRRLHELDHDATHQKQARKFWLDRGGRELEPALGSGAIALLDARWLVNFAMSRKDAVLPRRQELPPEAFLSCDQVIAATSNVLRIVVLSYMWLHPSHPDPKGSTLQLLAEWCRTMLSSWQPRWGVFWDYASLHQHPDAERGIFRTKQEEELFQEGLRASSDFYSHSYTTLFKVTKFPLYYPQGYDLPAEANCAEFDQRGWPLVESSLANMTKGGNRVYENGCKYREGRLAPLTPERLRERLQTASFTNAKVDRPLVLELYRAQFVKCFYRIKELDFSGLRCYDEQVHLAEIIGAGCCPHLQKLYLRDNFFGVKGCRALANALSQPKAPHLTSLDLGLTGPPGSDEGVRILAEHLVQIERVGLKCAQLGVGACRALSRAACTIKMRSLTLVGVGNRQIDDLYWLAPFIMQHLKLVYLHDCQVGDAGCQALATAAAQHAPCPMIYLSLLGNLGISESGCLAHIGNLVQFCPHFIGLEMDCNLRESRVIKQMWKNKRWFS